MDDRQPDCSQSSTGALLRLYWMFFGVFPLPLILIYMFQNRPVLGTLFDIIFFIGVAALVAVRFLDIRYHGGLTGDGKPATLRDWQRYSALILALGVGGWVAARLLF